MAKQKRPGLRDRVARKSAADLLYGDLPLEGSQEPTRKTGSRKEPGNPTATRVPASPITREARGLKKATYTLPLSVIESVNKRHAELFSARPGKHPIEKSQIVAAALERGLDENWDQLRAELTGGR